MKKKKKDKLFVTGIVDMTSSGAAFVTSPDFLKDIYIPRERTKNALNGDTVKVVVRDKNQQRLEGRIVEIVERKRSTYSGTITVSERYGFFRADSSKMPEDIFIPFHKLNNAKDGQKVIVNLIGWEDGDKNPTGEVTEVLGEPGEHGAEMNSIIEEYGLPTYFPANVRSEAENLKTTISDEEISKRKDFRKILTLTIDPADAKDFDDAISLRKLGNGNWEVGVHIADVSYYVRPGSPIDKEAHNRATSVYLVDRVIPMLPEVLCNDACSLRPNEDKLCFAAVFEMDESANIKAQWIGKTVIHSARRFNYEEVQAIIEGGDDALKEEIHTLNKLARKLRERRMKEGSIAFEKTETKFKLDANGVPVDVIFYESNEAHELIEDFMLLANRKVAELVGKPPKEEQKEKVKQKETSKKRPVFVYRVHDAPDEEKLKKFSEFLQKSGIKSNFHMSTNLSADFNELIANARNKPYENILNMLAIRTMAKAIYTTKNIGHYGLGFDYYTHFTSPIRRYPDLMVHRLLDNYLRTEKTTDDRTATEASCEHSSKMERLAEEAERTSIKFKQVQYMDLHKDEVFEGLISGVTEFGFFVELKANKCEGLVRAHNLKDDHYIYDEKNYCLKGKRTGRKFQLGAAVMVKVRKTDLVRKYIDFELVK
jgi:ribonuclease R